MFLAPRTLLFEPWCIHRCHITGIKRYKKTMRFLRICRLMRIHICTNPRRLSVSHQCNKLLDKHPITLLPCNSCGSPSVGCKHTNVPLSCNTVLMFVKELVVFADQNTCQAANFWATRPVGGRSTCWTVQSVLVCNQNIWLHRLDETKRLWRPSLWRFSWIYLRCSAGQCKLWKNRCQSCLLNRPSRTEFS